MRSLVGAGAALFFIVSGTAQAAPLEASSFSGHWRTVETGCEQPLLVLNDRVSTKQGKALVGEVRSGAVEVRGKLMLDGPQKGRLISDRTGKPAFQLIPVKDGLRLTGIDKATGLKPVTVTLCAGTRPDYAVADRIERGLPGAWYEVAKTGSPVFNPGAFGVKGCAKPGADKRQRGDMVFVTENGKVRWSVNSKAGFSAWQDLDPQPDTAMAGKTWLKLAIGPGGAARLVSLVAVEGKSHQRIIVAEPDTRKFRYFEPCPA